MPKTYSAEEVREQVIEHVSRMVDYWAKLPGLSVEDRCEGVAFSLLTMIDGAAAVPHLSLVVSGDYEGDPGEQGYAAGTVINADCDLHDVYMEAVRKAKGIH